MKAIVTISVITAIAILLASSTAYNVMAFPHAHMTIVPEQDNANPISVVMGHSSEPAFGAKLALHDGKHNVELFLEDAATALPLSGANLRVDKYFFKDIDSFNRATSVNDADVVIANATLSGVFGEPGHYVNRQIVRDGIYGYHVYGTIDYFGVAEVPFDSTIFCNSAEGNTSRYNSEGWGGGFGCPEDLSDIRFPPFPMSSPATANSQPTSLENGNNQYQLLTIGLPLTGLAAFVGLRKWKQKKKR